METTFQDEAKESFKPRRWERITVILGAPLIAAALFSAPASAEPPAPTPAISAEATPVGAADDMSDLDRMIMEIWIGQKLGAGFDRLLHGDGGGQGSEVSGPCPVCGKGNYNDDDAGAAALMEHLRTNHWSEWARVVDPRELLGGNNGG